MAWRSIGFGSVALAAVAMAGYSMAGSAAADGPGAIDQARLEAADSDADNWLGYGRTYDEQRFSPLEQINAGNVGQLSVAWAMELDTNRGQEGTPRALLTGVEPAGLLGAVTRCACCCSRVTHAVRIPGH